MIVWFESNYLSLRPLPEFIYHNYKVMEDVNTTVTLNHLFMFSVKLNGVEFHGNKLIVEEAKAPRNNLQQK